MKETKTYKENTLDKAKRNKFQNENFKSIKIKEKQKTKQRKNNH